MSLNRTKSAGLWSAVFLDNCLSNFSLAPNCFRSSETHFVQQVQFRTLYLLTRAVLLIVLN